MVPRDYPRTDVDPEQEVVERKLAAYHGKQWEFFLNNARAKSNKGFSTARFTFSSSLGREVTHGSDPTYKFR